MATVSTGRDWESWSWDERPREREGPLLRGPSLAHDLLFAVAPVPIVENTMKTRVTPFWSGLCHDVVSNGLNPNPNPNIGRRPLQTLGVVWKTT